jgi:prepilin-type N-terminal cleavage/methylation domain-containing protein
MSQIEQHVREVVPASHVVRGSLRTRVTSPGHTPRGRAAARPSGRTGSLARASTDQDGFTLVELLVVVLVLATLVGIAVPTFVQQREGAWGAAVSSELRAAVIALESSRAQNATYSASVLAAGAGWGYEPSSSVQLRYEISADGYCLIAWFDPDSADDSPAEGFTQLPSPPVQLWGATPAGVGEVDGPGSCDA